MVEDNLKKWLYYSINHLQTCVREISTKNIKRIKRIIYLCQWKDEETIGIKISEKEWRIKKVHYQKFLEESAIQRKEIDLSFSRII